MNADQNRPLTGTHRKQWTIAGLMLSAALLTPVATTQAAIYNFELNGPNTATDGAGNVIAMTGAGRFDTEKKTVAAHGSYTVTDSTGAVVSKGTWAANKFTGFTDTGGSVKGFWTGNLSIDVALWTHRGYPIDGTLPMTVYCEPGEVPGPAEANSSDGITVGGFATKTGGYTLFQLVRN